MSEQQRQEHEPDETMQVESEEQEQGKREIEVREENLPSRARRRCMNRSGWKAKRAGARRAGAAVVGDRRRAVDGRLAGGKGILITHD